MKERHCYFFKVQKKNTLRIVTVLLATMYYTIGPMA
jgi:hypothetical protein